MGGVQELVNRAKNITAVNFSRNGLRSIDELDKIKEWNLTELILDHNPLCDKFTSRTEYVRYFFHIT